jgi:hypothetical protein
MRRALLVLALALLAGCGSIGPTHSGTGRLVGLPASEAICRVAKEGLSYRIGSGPVVKPTPEIACRRVDGPQPRVVHVARAKQLVLLRATCAPTVGCL